MARTELGATANAFLVASLELAARHRTAGRYASAHALLTAARGQIDFADDQPRWQALVLEQIGRTQTRERKPDDALATLHKSLRLAQQIGDELAQASILNALGATMSMQTNFELADDRSKMAIEYHRQALEIASRLKMATAISADDIRRCRSSEAEAHFNLGVFAEQSSGDQTAKAHYEDGLKAAKLAGDRILVAFCSRHLGSLAEKANDLNRAQQYYLDSLVARREAGNAAGAGFAFASLAQFMGAKRGDSDGAQALLDEALLLMTAAADPVGTAVVRLQLAQFHESKGELKQAAEHARRCLEAAQGQDVAFLTEPAQALLRRIRPASE